MVNWKNVLGTSVLSAGLVFSSFAPLAFAETTTTSSVSNSSQVSSELKSLPFLGKHTGGPFDLGLVNEDKVLELLIKEGIVSKNASSEVQQKQLQDYLTKRAKNAEVLGTNQQEIKQVRTEMQKKAGLELKDAGLPKAPITSKVKNSSKKSSAVAPIEEESWNGPVKKDKVLVLLMEYPDAPHNKVKAEDGPVLLYKDYSQQHFQDMVFGDHGYEGPDGQNFISVKEYYEQQSGGSYTIEGQVSKWYMASQPAAYYGGNVPTPDGNDAHPRSLINEALAKAAQDPDINLNEYDQNDEFDLDGDGIYNEPDGIIDHLMVIHSGVGEEAGGGSLGGDAIWSHSSSTFYPIPNTNTDVPYWDGQLLGYGYTVEPEDGAAGVFAHEFGHDLGLPDEYDTMYTHNSVGAPTGYWTIMSQGSWAGKINGTEPTGFSPYDKEYLQSTMPGSNWFKNLEYNLEDLTSDKYVKLDEASVKGTNADAVKINLPNKLTEVNKPNSGTYEYFSGSADDLMNSMSTNVDLTGKTSAELSFYTWYSIEEGYDYAYVEVSEDEGKTWNSVEGNITTNDDPYEANAGNGITGNTDNKWVEAKFDLTKYAGKQVSLRFNYVTDAGLSMPGMYVDDIQVTADGETLLSDNADSDTTSFEFHGFTKNNGIKESTQYYLAEWRNYAAADEALAHIGRGNSELSLDPGLVIWYVDNKYTDNWVGDHPGEGFLGVVDAHQATATWKDGDINDGVDGYGTAVTTYQIQDAAFSLNKTDETYLDYINLAGRYLSLESQPAATVFDDSRNYSNPGQIYAGRNVPNYGLKIHVVGQAEDMSVGAIEIHKGNEEVLTLDPLATDVYSNQEGHNKVTVTGTAHNDGTGESLAVTYELVNSNGEVVKSKSDELTGLYQNFKKSFTLPKDTPTGDYAVKVTATNASGEDSTDVASFKVDNDAPTVVVDNEGNSASAKEAAVKVTLNDADPSTLEYVWAKDEKAPAEGWKSFTNGEILKLQGENGTWYLHVRAKDALGNALNWTSKAFALDNTAPVLKLKGDNPLQVEKGKEFKDPGFMATDDVDGDLASVVKVTSSVDVNKVGQYTVTYSVTDKSGNVASVTRTVKVVAKAPTTGNTGNNNGSSNGNSGSTQSGNLPVTATSMFNLVVAGLLTLAIGLTTLVVQRRRKKLV
jgi:M6 family metalloprotease-like protein